MKQHRSIRIDQGLAKAVQELADKERRSFNNQVECLLERVMAEDHGYKEAGGWNERV